MKYCPKAQIVKLGTNNMSGIVWAELGREREEIEATTHPCPTTRSGVLVTLLGNHGLRIWFICLHKNNKFEYLPSPQKKIQVVNN